MSDARLTPGTTPRPRWWGLYAIAALAVGGVALVDLSTPAPVLRMVLECGGAAAGWGAVYGWVKANRAALDRRDRGDGAARTIAIRIIRSSPRPSVEAGAATTSRGSVVRMQDIGPRRRRAPRPVLR